MKLRLVVADDDYLVREGVTALLERVDELQIVATAADFDGLLEVVERHRPDVVLTDIRMPPTHTDEGIQAARRIRDGYPGTGVVVLSQHAEGEYAYDLLANDAAGLGYLLKERVGHVDELTRALVDVAGGGSALDPKIVSAMLAANQRAGESPVHRLSEREREVLALMAQGKNNDRIATELTVTVRAVEKHINAMFAKLDLTEEPAIHRRVMAVLTFLGET